MLLWCIKVFILSALVITLGHFLWEHFNEQTNQPKIHQYDKAYKKILNVLEQDKTESITPVHPSPQPDTLLGPQIVPQAPPAPPKLDTQIPPYVSSNMPPQMAPQMPTQSAHSQQVSSDTTSIVNLPAYEEQNMEDSLKEFMVNNT
jgi:hypothetical protein